jgi:large subunit ribosomal protein L10
MALGTMIAPISGLANVLNANIRGLAVALQAIADQKSA